MLRSLLLFIPTLYALDSVASLVIRDEEGNRFYPIEGWEPQPSALEQKKNLLPGSRLSQPGSHFFHTNQRKRQIERNNEAAFVLRVNPIIPRHPPSLKNYSKECVERKSWCVELPSEETKMCKHADTPTPQPRTCGPTKPASDDDRIHLYCNFDRKKGVPVVHDPCDECPTTMKRYTQFVGCLSKPPPTAFARLKNCNPTTKQCHLIPCTYKLLDHLSTPPPPQPPKCDLGSLKALREPDSKFYILVKRSSGSWRSKRSRPRRRFRIVPDKE